MENTELRELLKSKEEENMFYSIRVGWEGDLIQVDIDLKHSTEEAAEKIAHEWAYPYAEHVLGIYTNDLDNGNVSATIELC